MISRMKFLGLGVALSMVVSGCARLAPQEAFDDVAFEVGERIGKRVQWDMGTSDDLAANAGVRSLLSRQLAPASAVQIALLNNKSLQASYAEVGIAQANLVQAGLLRNPVFDGAVTWFNDAGGTPNLAFGVAWSFVDLLQRPKRKAVARSALEEAKLEVARRVIVHAADTHTAFIDFVAATQEVELFRSVVKSARATVNAAAALRKAGNITALQFEQNQSFLTQAKLELAQAEARGAEARETLNVLMGLTGSQTRWSAPNRLPGIAGAAINTHDIERRAVQASLEIAIARQKLVTLGRQFRLVRKQSLLPDVDGGVEYEREVEVEADEETGEKEKTLREAFGPTFGVEIPIFDRGQARKAGVLLKIRAAEDSLWALAVRVRSAARLTRARLETAGKTERYYRKAVLPQRERILQGTQRDYNAMQESIFQLIAAKRQQILAGREFIQAQRAYWIAHVRFQQLMSGALPGAAGEKAVEMASAGANGGDAGGH
ncbi:MAG: TolC family protein [Hyphomicrobiales bacterium]|nr:TolC family protein [Hyphomicrobiales bacterium]